MVSYAVQLGKSVCQNAFFPTFVPTARPRIAIAAQQQYFHTFRHFILVICSRTFIVYCPRFDYIPRRETLVQKKKFAALGIIFREKQKLYFF